MERRTAIIVASSTFEVERDWLRFDILTDGTILWKCATDKERTISYRKNGEEWTKITSTTSGVSISVAVGDVLEFKGKNTDYGGARSQGSAQGSYFDGTATFNVSGDISTMLNNSKTLPADLALAHFFHNAKVVSAKDLILPYMTLTSACYYGLFYNCSDLTTAPALPAKTLADGCYQCMFYNCYNLTAAPQLPAKTLADYCYNYMFCDCYSLATAPALPATTLADSCYRCMFLDCCNLTTAPQLPAKTLADYCYCEMFNRCGLTTAPTLPATTLADSCYSYMFNRCTGLTTAPQLPATTLANSCYSNMFSGCTSLTTAPALPATTLTYYCYSYMFSGCTSLNSIKCLATNIISNGGCTTDWVKNVASSGTFTKAASMSSWTTGTSGIPSGWTTQNYT